MWLVPLLLAGQLASPPAPPPAPSPAPPAVGPVAAPFGPGVVDVAPRIPEAQVRLGYSSEDNFLRRDVYGDLERCFLVEDAVRMLAAAHALLQQRAPGVTFVLYDCARPRSVQLLMWEVVAGTKQQGYVANPHKPPGSVHNRGCAVDLSLWDTRKGAPLDMGTPWDFFGPAAEPRREAELWKEGKLSSEQLANRLLLREVMLRAGFGLLAHEWWHFDCARPGVAAQRYPILP
jgi:D-alanyl-D-alanine dipeptidase